MKRADIEAGMAYTNGQGTIRIPSSVAYKPFAKTQDKVRVVFAEYRRVSMTAKAEYWDPVFGK